MNCPPEIAPILCRILRIGILNARACGWQNDAKAAALEADHIHNLPHLLSDFSQRKLEYYWRIERLYYLEKRLEFSNRVLLFEGLWAQLKSAASYLNESETNDIK